MILKKMVNPLPGIPGCFIGDTLLTLNTKEQIKMKDIDVGMVLEDDNIVTSKNEACICKGEII